MRSAVSSSSIVADLEKGSADSTTSAVTWKFGTAMKCPLIVFCLVVLACQALGQEIIPGQDEVTCMALSALGSGVADPLLNCTPSDNCNQATCTPTFAVPALNDLDLQFNLTLLPCEEPDSVAVEVTIFAGTTELDSSIYTDDTMRTFPVQSPIPTIVTLTVNLTQLADGIEIQIIGSIPLPAQFTVLPLSEIPVSSSECPPPGSESGTTESSTSITTPDLPSLETTCEALTEFVEDNDGSLDCVINQGCDGLECSPSSLSNTVKMEVIVLPCNDPPGISLKITYFGNVVFDQIVADDVETNIAPGKLTVTFTELENAIGVEIELKSIVIGTATTGYLEIPIDTSTCEVGNEDSGQLRLIQGGTLVVLSAAIASLLASPPGFMG